MCLLKMNCKRRMSPSSVAVGNFSGRVAIRPLWRNNFRPRFIDSIAAIVAAVAPRVQLRPFAGAYRHLRQAPLPRGAIHRRMGWHICGIYMWDAWSSSACWYVGEEHSQRWFLLCPARAQIGPARPVDAGGEAGTGGASLPSSAATSRSAAN